MFSCYPIGIKNQIKTFRIWKCQWHVFLSGSLNDNRSFIYYITQNSSWGSVIPGNWHQCKGKSFLSHYILRNTSHGTILVCVPLSLTNANVIKMILCHHDHYDYCLFISLTVFIYYIYCLMYILQRSFYTVLKTRWGSMRLYYPFTPYSSYTLFLSWHLAALCIVFGQYFL